MPLSLSEFEFERGVVEIRYPNGYLFWDRAGAIWHDAVNKRAELEFISAEPAKTSFRLGPKYQLDAEIAQARVTAFRPDSSLTGVSEIAKIFFDDVVRHLQIVVLSRIGLRCLLFKEFATPDEATAALFQTGLCALPQGPIFSHKAGTPQIDFTVRMEDDVKGTMFHLAYQKREFVSYPPVEIQKRVEPLKLSFQGVLLDVDFYTTAPVQVAQFGVHEWIEQCVHLLRRDTDKLLTAK